MPTTNYLTNFQVVINDLVDLYVNRTGTFICGRIPVGEWFIGYSGPLHPDIPEFVILARALAKVDTDLHLWSFSLATVDDVDYVCMIHKNDPYEQVNLD